MRSRLENAFHGNLRARIAQSGALIAMGMLASCTGENSTGSTLPPVVLSALTETSYTLTAATLNISGSLNLNDVTPLTVLRFYPNSACSGSILGQGIENNFTSTGILLTVPSTGKTSIYLSTNTDTGCYYLADYNPLHLAPPAPTFDHTSPASPSRVSSTPAIFGSTAGSVSQLLLYSDSACTLSIGSGTAAAFSSTGITLTVPQNATTSIYAKAVEPFGSASACTLLTTYTHSNTGPSAPIFTSITPLSPNNVSTTPTLAGQTDSSTVSVSLFSDAACSAPIGNATKAVFLIPGISITVAPHTSTSVWGIAYDSDGNPSPCAYLTTYVFETTPPSPPSFIATSPASPTRMTIYPKVQGLAPNNPSSLLPTVSINLFNDFRCTTMIGSGPKASFTGTGITVSATSNYTITIFAQSVDAAGNLSGCTSLSDFTNDTIAPDAPVFTATNPISPNNLSITPLVIGGAASSAPLPTTVVSLYSDDACTLQIGSGSPASFEGSGIQITVPSNSSTTVYSAAFDTLGNKSTCAFLTNYSESTILPPPPVFSSASPVSPSNVSNTPNIIGTTSAIITAVHLYSDAACTTQVGTGSKNTFTSVGVHATLAQNTVNSVYANATDVYGNTSPCALLTTYVHDNVKPLAPSFSAFTPVSPNNQSFTPMVTGLTPNNPASVLPTNSISFYDSSLCVNRIGTGSAANFTASGVQITVPQEVTTSVYAKAFDAAGNYSTCTYFADYTYDTLPPGKPIFGSATPKTPSYTQATLLKGTLGANVDILPATNVSIYSDPACTNLYATGLASLYTTTGIPVTAAENAVTTFYGQTVDAVGNLSACNHLLDYVHNDIGPTNLQSTVNLNGSVALTWNPDLTASPNALYVVKRATRSGGPYTVLNPGNSGTFFLDSAITNGAHYYYVIAATNNTGTSFNSSETVATISTTTPVAPLSLTAVPGPLQITLTWQGDPSALMYTLFRGTHPGGPYVPVATGLTSTTFTDLTVPNDAPYYYEVAALNPAGFSTYSNEASAVAKDVPPGPTQLSATWTSGACGFGQAGISLSWSSPPYSNSFVIGRGPTSNGEAAIGFTAGNTYLDCAPIAVAQPNNGPDNPDLNNYYTVSAKWGNSIGSPSNEVVVSNTPAPLLFAGVGNTQTVLTWSGIANATGYQVMRSLVQGGPYTTLATVPTPIYTDTISNGVGYFYTVQAILPSGGLGNFSNEASGVGGANPSAPTHLTLNIANNLPTLTWSAPPQYNAFQVYRAASGAGPWTPLFTLNNPAINTYTDTGPMTGMNFYQVTALWGGYETAPTASVSFRNGVPTSLTATHAATSVSLSWPSVTGASNYAVKRATISGGPYTVISGATSSPYSDTPLTPGTGYFYVVSANFPDSTTGQNSPEASTIPGGSTVPSGLTAVSTTASSVGLSWAAVNGATTYKIYKGTVTGGPYTYIGFTVSTNNAMVSGLLSNTNYFFVVSSITTGTESSKSTEISARTVSPPGAPLVTIGDTTTDLLWAPVTGATYTLQRSADGVAFTTIVTGITTGVTQYTDTGLTNGVLYFYRLIAVVSGQNYYSGTTIGATPGITPLTPQGLAVTGNTTGTDVILGWARSTGVTGYNVYESTVSGGPYSLVSSTSSNSGMDVGGLTSGTPYYFVVSALNGGMESGTSQEIATIPLASPAAPAVTIDGSGNAALTWSAVPGAATYTILRSGDSMNYTPIATGVGTANYTDSSIASATPYSYEYLPIFAGPISSAPSLPSVIVTSGTRPLAPTALIFSASVTPSVTLSWVQSPNVDFYHIYRGTSVGGPYTSLTTIASTSTTYLDSTVSPGTVYSYVVTGINPSGVESLNSNEVDVDLTTAPSGISNSTTNGSVVVNWTVVGGAASYTIERSTTPGGPYTVIASGVAGTSYTDGTVEDGVTYYYVVVAVYPSGAVSPNSPETTVVPAARMNLQIPIELTDHGLASNTGTTLFESTRTSLDPSAYDGTVTYFFEAVATNSDNASHSVSLVDSAGSTVATLTVPALTGSPLRIRVAASPNPSWDSYRIALDATSSTGQLQVYSSRLLVNQTGASRTRIYIPLLNSDAAPSSGDLNSPLATTSSGTYASLARASTYIRNTSVYSDLEEFNAWELETLVAATGNATGEVGLNDMTQANTVSYTEALFSNNGITLTNSPFDEGTTGFDSSTEGDLYQVSVRCVLNCAGSVSLYKAGLWVTLTNLSKVEVLYRLNPAQTGVGASTSFDLERTLLNLTLFSNPTVYFQAMASAPVSGSAIVTLTDDGVQDSGTAGYSTVAGSALSFTSSSSTLVRTASPITPTTGNRFLLNVAPTGGAATLSDSAIVIDSVR